jgi:hypothetical protein
VASKSVKFSEAGVDPVASDMLETMRGEFLECREGQHSWPRNAGRSWRVIKNIRGRVVAYRRTMMCVVCGTIRRDIIDARNAEKSTYYRHPDGYKMPKGSNVTKRDYRLELIRRVRDSITEVELEEDES